MCIRDRFTNVQKSRIFADSKTFPDCAPKHDPLDILRNYRKVKRQPDFDLRQFVEDVYKRQGDIGEHHRAGGH